MDTPTMPTKVKQLMDANGYRYCYWSRYRPFWLGSGRVVAD